LNGPLVRGEINGWRAMLKYGRRRNISLREYKQELTEWLVGPHLAATMGPTRIDVGMTNKVDPLKLIVYN